MFRVLLKISKVIIKIKEAVQLHIIIKKDHFRFTYCKNQMLINGQLVLNHTAEFFISSSDLSFHIETYLRMGQVRKLGGIISLDLKQYGININHVFTQSLQNSPLNSSKMTLEIILMRTQLNLPKSLISLHQIEQTSHQNHLKSINVEKEHLKTQNQRLADSIKSLRDKNSSFRLQAMTMEANEQVKESEHREQMCRMQEQMNEMYKSVVSEKRKVAEIVSIINESGYQQIINEMDKIISGKKISSSQQ